MPVSAALSVGLAQGGQLGGNSLVAIPTRESVVRSGSEHTAEPIGLISAFRLFYPEIYIAKYTTDISLSAQALMPP
jgi:hypothetical protein